MNKVIIGLGLLLCSNLTIGQEDPIEVNSTVESVTVYPRGAQIERRASKSLTAGRQFLVFPGLASELDASSISVSTNDGVSVMSVASQVNYLKLGKRPKHVQMLDDSLKAFEFDHKFNQNMLSVYTEEKAMILANKNVGWSGQGSDFLIEDLEDLSDFYRDRLADIMLKVMQLEQKQTRLNLQINRMRKQLGEHNAKLNRSTGEILIEVHVPKASSAKFTLSYLVRSAGWIPSYNVNVTDVDKPLKFAYNAKVYQNTGIDWNSVDITLTNANPNLSGNKPEIHPWRLYFIEGGYAAGGGYDLYSNKMESMQIDGVTTRTLAVAADDMTGADLEYPVNDAVTQFKIKAQHNIPSNGKHQGLSIDEFEIPAKYEYYCAPKVDPTAFLIARVSEFEKYDLLPGEANLFFTNTYVGKVYINPNSIADTFDLSLGRDQSIIVKREKITEFCETKKIGNSTKESLGIEVSIRNTKGTKIHLIIEDQIPISSNKEIEVNLESANTAKHTENTGKLRWSKNIMAGSTEVMTFRYSIKYPSGKKINL
jgi:uncharacterized protein (TIGR02231 family)